MNVQEFFTKHIEGYLFGDLESLERCEADKKTGYGGCGYPKLQTIISGMELLGLLLPEGEIKEGKKHEKHFLNFWNNYLTKFDERYKNKGFFIYNLVRHGLAHNYTTKYGIYIGSEKDFSVEHFWFSIEHQQFFIDPDKFKEDFYKCYKERVSPLIYNASAGNTDLITINEKLTNMLKHYKKETNRFFNKLQCQHPDKTDLKTKSTKLSGASGVSGPIKYTATTSGTALTSNNHITTPPEDWINNTNPSAKNISDL